mmetsp:Transcript_1893/g.2734  ORF Transcript_1893/g.2734 Transcript_1893/m.2734 type:complete len:141 (+) Transcript_1893:972-1394(+)|eukprot:CAMPEP_0185568980 /NCGR_PEP_ID=MMETSP0434-20130131/1760_1 /TAXON_ID=626734 ORGANISM="Favella taraikaensis, Strain Fe Narragansett Bay" /NCGR_SAMPLE_ID=MMETSP0434 /ASSEMBLY_ACC=CAM_ASM_000379 /LENGTH=140 /DNA_ID=CAMNT_0028183637 /DNA_START=882 /DNA_END=1304 /DNA_ORIENTATION=-
MDPWTAACAAQATFSDSIDSLSEILNDNPFEVYESINDTLGTVRVMYGVGIVAIVAPLLSFACKLGRLAYFVEPIKMHKTVFFFICVPVSALVLAALIAELVLYMKISSSKFYGSDIYAHFRGVEAYKGCSGAAFDIAVD